MSKKQKYGIITIENFPSRAELIYLLNNFLKQNNYPKNYKWENREATVDVIFPDSTTALEFLALIEKQKTNNILYSKTNITMTMKYNNTHGFPSNKSASDARNISSGLTLKSLSKLNRKKRPSKAIGLNMDSNQKIENSYSHNHLLDLASKAGVIANDSPYMSQLEQMTIEAKENRKKWISKQNFCLFINRANSQINLVKNYVRITPSIPACNYMFRGIFKDKWVNKKDFRPW